MHRDLNRLEQEGEDTLAQNPRYDLNSREIQQIFDSCGISEQDASDVFPVLQKTLYIGVGIGRRLAR